MEKREKELSEKAAMIKEWEERLAKREKEIQERNQGHGQATGGY